MVYFDIKSEDGMARESRFSSFKSKEDRQWIRTPSYIVPLNEYLIGNKHFMNILSENKNILLKISDEELEIPNELSKLNCIYNLNHTYFDESGEFEDIFSEFSKNIKKNGIPLISINCPSSFLSMSSFNNAFNEFKANLIHSFLNIEPNIREDFEFGISIDMEDIDMIDIFVDKIISLINQEEVYEHIKILDISGLFNNFMHYRVIFDTIYQLRTSIPSDIIICASGKVRPEYYVLLAYLGIDFIDSTFMMYSGLSDMYYGNENFIWKREIKNRDFLTCLCNMCKSIGFILDENKRSDEKLSLINDSELNSLISLHNLNYGLNELRKIRYNLQMGTLRTYLERKSSASTFLTSTIRYMDNLPHNPIESIQRLYKSSKLVCPGSLSHMDPQITKFRNLIKNNVEWNSQAKMVVFLPCSMTKPYSKSKSHRKFIKSMRKASSRYYKYIQQIIITSPLSLVPRELEYVYPAAHYDISVTGTWDQEEIAITADSIANYLEKIPNNVSIIAYLTGGYKESFEKALKIIGNSKVAKISEDLIEFESLVENYFTDFEKDTIKKRKISDEMSKEEQELKYMADLQFGIGAGELMIGTSARVLNSRNEKYKEIIGYESYGKVMLGRIDRSDGKISLTLAGGERLVDLNKNQMILNIDTISGSTIFKPALKIIDLNLCSGDDVLILNNNSEYIGIGEMIVNAKTALLLRRGAIAKIRKKKK